MTIYDLCWILAPEGNGKHNQSESYTEKYQKRVSRIYGYKLLCVNDKFSKLFKSNLGKDNAFKFINSMVEESKYCIDVMKIILTKNL